MNPGTQLIKIIIIIITSYKKLTLLTNCYNMHSIYLQVGDEQSLA